jgi:hypothetical protein
VAAESLGESDESVIEAESSLATIPCMLVEEGEADVLERGIVVQSPVFTYMYNSAAALDSKETRESKTNFLGNSKALIDYYKKLFNIQKLSGKNHREVLTKYAEKLLILKMMRVVVMTTMTRVVLIMTKMIMMQRKIFH